MPRVGTAPRILQPYWSTVDRRLVRLYHGHVVDVLKRLPEKSVHCVTTSPPYWGLRDYGVDGQLGSEPSPDCGTNGKAQCGRCFVCAMVEVFREVYRVLRDDGTLWLNLGDSYGGYSESRSRETASDAVRGVDNNFARLVDRNSNKGTAVSPGVKSGLKSGNLIGVPWRVALALQADGWILRQDIIWHKPSPMPESVRNRCTKAHEYVFLFAKRSGYFYDAEAVREEEKNPGASAKQIEYQKRKAGTKLKPVGVNHSLEWFTPESERDSYKGGRNKRSVWTVSPQGYEGAHFATYPPKLIEPMIKAGTSEKGCCSECGAPWKRVVEEKQLKRDRPNDFVKYAETRGVKSGLNKDRNDGGRSNVGGNSCANSVAGVEVKTVGWEPTCECDASVIPCTVLDPFIGSGTTCDVSLGLGRRSIGIDLSKDYLDNNAIPRIEGALMSRPNLAALVPREVERVDMGEEL